MKRSTLNDTKLGDTNPQGSMEIAAPGALRSVNAKRKRRKKSATELLPPAAADRAVVYVG
jgi:hypothetical protein